MTIKFFINLPVKNLNSAKEFFTRLGFTVDANCMDDRAASIILDKNVTLMLLTEEFFTSFSNQPVTDTGKANEVIVSLEVDSRDEVDKFADALVNSGADKPESFSEGNWMYGIRFRDVDGHIFEVFHVEYAALPETEKKGNES